VEVVGTIFVKLLLAPPPFPPNITIGKVELSPFVKVIVLLAIEAVTKNEPVFIAPAELLISNALPV